MMKLIYIALAFAIATPALAADKHHEVHKSAHAHQHKIDCGHAAEWHNDHFDYNHDGHDHHQHHGKIHEGSAVIHKEHKHGHGLNCGHETRIKNGLVEYKHGEHWHHQHGSHMHETHS